MRRCLSILIPALIAGCDSEPSRPRIPGDGSQPIDACATEWDTDFTDLETTLERERVELDATAVAFAVWEGTELVFAVGLGERHPTDGGEVPCDALFRIGSVTKVLTVTGVLQQVAAGELGLTDPVQNTIPELDLTHDSGWSADITVEHTLTHQGGFVDYVAYDAGADHLLEQTLTGFFVDNIYLMAPPGRMWNYSNPNFAVAGLLLERAGGRYYRDYMRNHVLDPLGMERTLFVAEEVLADGNYTAAMTTDWETGVGQRIVEPDSYDSAYGRPAGFAWSSVVDLFRFGQFLTYGNPAVLDEDLRLSMSTAHVQMLTNGGVDAYGYGLFVYDGFYLGNDWYDVRMVTHGGAISGFSADIYLLPDLEIGLAALASGDGAYFTNTIDATFQRADLPSPSTPPDNMPDPSTFPDLAGSWLDPWNTGPMEISVESNKVYADFSDLDTAGIPYARELVPLTRDNFLLRIQGHPMLMTFLYDDTGQPEWARTRIFVHGRVTNGGPRPSGLQTDRLPPTRPALPRQQSLPRCRTHPRRFLAAVKSASSADRARARLLHPDAESVWR